MTHDEINHCRGVFESLLATCGSSRAWHTAKLLPELIRLAHEVLNAAVHVASQGPVNRCDDCGMLLIVGDKRWLLPGNELICDSCHTKREETQR